MNDDKSISEKGLELNKVSEGFCDKAYPDPKSGGAPWTIGYGHTENVKRGDTCTQVQGEAWLLEDLQDAEAIVKKHVTVELNDGQYSALVDFVINMGAGRARGTLGPDDPGKDGLVHLASGGPSTLLRLTNAGDFGNAALQFEHWDKAGPPGLWTRHRRQRELYQTGSWT